MPPDEAEKSMLERIFQGSKYRLSWQPDMDAWLRSHLAFICGHLPLLRAGLRPEEGQPGAASPGARRRPGGLRPSGALGFPILPEGEERFYERARSGG
jgi:hypothetical protein